MESITPFKELRPAEALYLMEHLRWEECLIEDSLTAVLVYLAVKGYIEVEGERFTVTDKGEKAIFSHCLRDYESEILGIIMRHEDDEDIIDLVECYSFRKYFLKIGLLEKKPRKFLLVIPYKITTISVECDFLAGDLLTECNHLKELVRSGQKVEDEKVALMYAFPSLIKSDDFKEYAEEFINIMNENDPAKKVMTIAVTAANISKIILKASLFNPNEVRS